MIFEVGPPRKLITDKKDYYKFINAYNGRKSAVYKTIYNYEKIREDDEKKPDYKSVLVDNLFFDFDDKSCNAYEECYRLHKHLLEDDIKHKIVMSGRGYHLFIYTNIHRPVYRKETIKGGQDFFIKKLELNVDKQVIGNPAQMARVPNTYNMKAKRYCIPLTKEQFYMGDDKVKELALKQNFVKDIFIGEKLFDLKEYDKESEEEVYIENIQNESSEDIELSDIPPCIESILKKGDVGWRGRYILITYFRDKSYSMEETFNILKKYLSTEKFNHCIQDEKQLQYLYTRMDLMFPNCDRIRRDGFCTNKQCNKYNKVIYII